MRTLSIQWGRYWRFLIHRGFCQTDRDYDGYVQIGRLLILWRNRDKSEPRRTIAE